MGMTGFWRGLFIFGKTYQSASYSQFLNNPHMNRTLLVLLLILSYSSTLFCQENKIGAMKTKKGTLLYFNSESPFTIDLEGNVNLDQYPHIVIDDKGFQFIQNTIEKNSKELKQNLEDYMKWELEYINKQLPEKANISSEFIVLQNETVNFWYFKNPVLKDAPKDITPYKMSFYLDWKIGDFMYRLVFPSFGEDITEAKQFLINLKKHFVYYSKEINLEKLYDNVSEGKNYYSE